MVVVVGAGGYASHGLSPLPPPSLAVSRGPCQLNRVSPCHYRHGDPSRIDGSQTVDAEATSPLTSASAGGPRGKGLQASEEHAGRIWGSAEQQPPPGHAPLRRIYTVIFIANGANIISRKRLKRSEVLLQGCLAVWRLYKFRASGAGRGLFIVIVLLLLTPASDKKAWLRDRNMGP